MIHSINFSIELLGQKPLDLERVLGLYNYWVVIFLMMTGFYICLLYTSDAADE